MSIRNTILKTLKNDMIKCIHSGKSPYTSDISEVKRGIHGYEDVVNRPFVGIAMEKEIKGDEAFATLGADQTREMPVYLYCYMESDGLGNYDDMHQLIEDIEYFLKYDFSYKENVSIEAIDFLEGGVTAPTVFFSMDLVII